MTENEYMPAIRENFQARCRALDLKKKAKDKEAACYMQGVLAALTATGVMDMARAGQIGFLFMVGRGTDFLDEKEEAHA